MNDKQKIDVGCGLYAVSLEALKELDLDKMPNGYTVDAWIKKQAVKKGWRIKQVPVRVRYFPEDTKLTPKNILKYARMFFGNLIEILRA